MGNTHTVVVFGSRSITDYEQVKAILDAYHSENPITCVVSGNANGADKIGERWASENGIPVSVHPANWDVYGVRAGMVRNGKMASVADHGIALWDGESRGTLDMIRRMRGRLSLFILDDEGGANGN